MVQGCLGRGAVSVSPGGGPVFAATVYDVTDSYRPAFIVLAGSILVALMLVLAAKPPKTPI